MKPMNEKMKWYILIAVALLLGAIIGYFATANLATTGNANSVFNDNSFNRTNYLIYGQEKCCLKPDTYRCCKGNEPPEPFPIEQ